MKRFLGVLLFSALIFLVGCGDNNFTVSDEYFQIKSGETASFSITGLDEYELIYDENIIKIIDNKIEFVNVGRTEVVAKISIFTSKTLFTVDCIPFLNGDGSLDDPFLISTEEEFNAIRFFYDKSYILTEDLTLKDYKAIELFTGTIDGNGHIINLSFHETTRRYVGLFEIAVSAIIKDISISVNQTINFIGFTGNTYGDEIYESAFGTLCAIADDTIINNCKVEGNLVINDSESVGGLVGVLLGDNSLVVSSYFSGDIRATEITFVGLLIGLSSGDVLRSYATGYVYASRFNRIYVGGLVGKMNGDLEQTYFEGNIDIEIISADFILDYKPINPAASYIGLLSGYTNDGIINKSYAVGKISSYANNEENVYSRPFFVGGITGLLNGSLKYSFVSCDYTVNEYIKKYLTVGAVFGKFENISDCKFVIYDMTKNDILINDEEELILSGSLIGKSTSEMYLEETYLEYYFDFDGTFITRDNNYPTLR